MCIIHVERDKYTCMYFLALSAGKIQKHQDSRSKERIDIQILVSKNQPPLKVTSTP